MKYKIVQKNYFDDYRGKEAIQYYIKRKNLLGIWYYASMNEDLSDRILFRIIRYLITVGLPIAIVPLYPVSTIGALLFFFSFIPSYFGVKYFGSLISRSSFRELSDAKESIITELKRSEFKTKTFDVIEISSTPKQITIEKKI